MTPQHGRADGDLVRGSSSLPPLSYEAYLEPVESERHPGTNGPPRADVVGCLSALKPHVQPSIMMPVLVGMVISTGRLPSGLREWLIPAALGLFYSGAISALNDFLDKKRDKINHPNRLLQRGVVSVRSYLMLFVGGPVVVGLGVLWAITPVEVFLRLLVLLVVIELMHLAYGLVPDLGLKGFARQSLLVVGPMLLLGFGCIAVQSTFPATLALAAVSVGLFFGFGIIAKDIVDVVGDRGSGLVTIPGSLGIRTAAWVSLGGHLPAFGVGAWMVRQELLGPTATPFFVCAGVMVLLSASQWIRAKPSRYWGVPMLVGYLSQFVFQAGLIAGVLE